MLRSLLVARSASEDVLASQAAQVVSLCFLRSSVVSCNLISMRFNHLRKSICCVIFEQNETESHEAQRLWSRNVHEEAGRDRIARHVSESVVFSCQSQSVSTGTCIEIVCVHQRELEERDNACHLGKLLRVSPQPHRVDALRAAACMYRGSSITHTANMVATR